MPPKLKAENTAAMRPKINANIQTKNSSMTKSKDHARPTSVNPQHNKDTPTIELEKSGLFSKLPGELRNRIYEFVVAQPRKIRLPRKPTDDRKSEWFRENRVARADGIQRFAIPALAKVCRLIRRECLGQYYCLNNFVFVFSCRERKVERSSLTSLRTAATFIGSSINILRSQALEIRFLSALNIRYATLRQLAVCFASMHANGLKIQTDPKKMIMTASTCGKDGKDAAPLRVIMIHMFMLGMLLSRQKCKCEKKTPEITSGVKPSVPMFECDRDARLEMERLMLCEELSRKDFLRPDIKNFLLARRDEFYDLHEDNSCPNGCCPSA